MLFHLDEVSDWISIDVWAWAQDHHLQLNLAKTQLLVFPANQSIHHNAYINIDTLSHVASVSQSALLNIKKIMTSRIDYSNVLLAGVLMCVVKLLQIIQNVTSLLIRLHWLLARVLVTCADLQSTRRIRFLLNNLVWARVTHRPYTRVICTSAAIQTIFLRCSPMDETTFRAVLSALIFLLPSLLTSSLLPSCLCPSLLPHHSSAPLVGIWILGVWDFKLLFYSHRPQLHGVSCFGQQHQLSD